jgi:hypothetical protein
MRAFFEGPAGTGKTYSLIERAVALAPEALAGSRQRLLALTFMNGARLRLGAKLSSVASLRGRFHCTTFDAFAGMITHRRRSLLRRLPELPPNGLSSFDLICRDAARLLEIPEVQRWVAAVYPVVLVDEAQDLSAARFRMLRALSGLSSVLSCADHFQNLAKGSDTSELMDWLRGCDEPVSLTQVRRTNEAGLLAVAGALRNGTPVANELVALAGQQTGFRGAGIRLIEAAAKPGLAAWAIANQLASMSPRAVVLTADASTPWVVRILERVQSPPAFNRGAGTFGPFALSWERRDEEEVAEICQGFPGDGDLPIADARAVAGTLTCPNRRRIIESIDLHRSLRGDTHLTRERLRAIVDDAVRSGRRFAPRTPSGRRIMTIARAKNREFPEVVVVWPPTVPADLEYQRRLLYNGVTRAQNNCCVIVLGQGRLSKPPFVPGTAENTTAAPRRARKKRA